MEEISNQLSQMQTALMHAPEKDKPGIQMIIDQLQELVGVYKSSDNNIQVSSGPPPTSTSISNAGESHLTNDNEDEYKLFQAEIEALSSEENQQKSSDQSRTESHYSDTTNKDSPDESKSIESELEALIGMKCMAPHQETWGRIGYYSAMVSSVLSLEGAESDEEPSNLSSIMVRVIFFQPTVKSQLLCPFFKEDKCKFSDQDCKFSHGEVVPLSQLREYTEPDYSSVVPGSRVLAKYHDDLWYKATVQKITDDGECEVSYDVGNEGLVLPLHETCPLIDDAKDELSSDSETSEDDIENPNLSSESDSELCIPKTLLGDGLLDMKGSSALGDWEKYTKGVGSKLMLQMGYVMGTGLGRNREGRVEPVDAIVLPPGKSLDACMELKEKAKDGNLFSAEKRRIKLQRKVEKQEAKLAAQKHKKEEATVFEFLNSKLSLRKTTALSNSNSDSSDLHKQSTSHLNKRIFGLNENLRQVQKDIVKTKESMKRHKGRDKETYSKMEQKLETLENKRRELNSMQNSIENEQKSRSDRKKLLIF